jgi:phosphatidylglycerophosphate synthase
VGRRLDWDEYATNWAKLHGGFDPRRAGGVVRGWLRMCYVIGSRLARIRITPSAVTTFGLLVCAAVAVVTATLPPDVGLLAGAGLVLVASVADSVDGAVAVVSGRVTPRGYVYDSVADRLGEGAWLAAVWLAGTPGQLVVAAGALSWLHEYVRARAVSAGMREIGSVTVGERPMRVSVTFVGLLLAGLAARINRDLAPGTLTIAMAVWVLLAVFGLGQLASAVRRSLG